MIYIALGATASFLEWVGGVWMKERQAFFEKLMNILDEAEGNRDTTYGPFSFLWENSYVRDAVVSSFDTTTSITGLKMYLAMDVLELHASGNSSRISYEQLKALLQEKSTKKYSINYTILDECIDVTKNKEAMRTKLYTAEFADKSQQSMEYLEKTDELFPYLFMDKLRSTVWSKLRDFFKLCEQRVCSECSKKSIVYFQFIQAVALYEIFYIWLLQEPAADYMENAFELVKEINNFNDQIKTLNSSEINKSPELIFKIQEATQRMNDRMNDKGVENIYLIEMYQLMKIEFGISLSAMFYLLMLFEAISAGSPEMRGIKHLSWEIGKKLSDIYDRDLAMLEKSNRKRAYRYRAVNKRIEELLENQYPKYEEYDAATVIDSFMEELCKPARQQRKDVLRGLEVMLGYPIYHEQKKDNA